MEKKNKKILHKSILLVIIVVASFILLSLFSGKGQNNPKIYPPSIFSKATVNLNDKTLSVLFADTDISRTQGLAGVTSLDDHQGMLFEFTDTSSYGIWMKDMIIPIDILWLNDNGHVVAIAEKIEPNTFPKVFKPEAIQARYVLELASGYVKRNGVKIGDPMIFSILKN